MFTVASSAECGNAGTGLPVNSVRRRIQYQGGFLAKFGLWQPGLRTKILFPTDWLAVCKFIEAFALLA